MSSTNHHFRAPFVVGLVLSCVGLAGCGGKSDEGPKDLIPVSGKVTVGGTPMPHGQVTFTPDTSKGNSGNFVPTGNINSDGTYKLICGGGTHGIQEGAPPGWYKVTVIEGAASDPNAKGKVPNYSPNYRSVKNTPLDVEVKAGAPAGAYDLKLKAQ